MTEGLSVADAMALQNRNGFMDNDGFFLLFLLLAWGGNGWGRNDNMTAWGNALTRSDMYDGFNTQDVNGQLRGITNGLCDGFYTTTVNQMQGQAALGGKIADLQFALKDCCCTTNRNIDAVRAENYKNTCEITTAIHAEGEATRALITANTMQDLRDRLADKDRDLQSARFQISQMGQNNFIDAKIDGAMQAAVRATQGYGCGCNGVL